jgi:catechol 2,3-dioxygenase-like lactoylglutathione lyase family enzyme
MSDTLHVGRLIDHVQLRVRDLEASRRFYRATLAVLGLMIEEADDHFEIDELYVDEGRPDAISHIHLAFQAADRAMVDRWYEAGLAAGGTDNGAPGERDYHPGYYGAFLLDPDGNNVEAVFHGPAERSAPSVEVRRNGER